MAEVLKRLLPIFLFVVCCLPAWAAADEPGEESVAATPPAAEDPARHVVLTVAPSYAWLLDGDTADLLGPIYGGTVALRYCPWKHLSAEIGVGYLIGYEKLDHEFAYVRYTRLTNSTFTPFYAAVNFEMRPQATVNPYVGLAAGGLYLTFHQAPEDVDSDIPLDKDELSITEQHTLPLLAGKAGLDVRLTENVGFFAEATYRYTGAITYDLRIPRAKDETELVADHLAGALGIAVYY
ncbi:MAG TPA: hypothetical protein PKW95_17645 [bacterium]|nr:hypothetical protein [bacterium]